MNENCKNCKSKIHILGGHPEMTSPVFPESLTEQFQVRNSYTKVKFGLIVEINDFFVILLAIQTDPAKKLHFSFLDF